MKLLRHDAWAYYIQYTDDRVYEHEFEKDYPFGSVITPDDIRAYGFAEWRFSSRRVER